MEFPALKIHLQKLFKLLLTTAREETNNIWNGEEDRGGGMVSILFNRKMRRWREDYQKVTSTRSNPGQKRSFWQQVLLLWWWVL